MFKKASLALIISLIASSAVAGNSNSVFVGDDAAIAAGAINAVVRDAESIWYNPAGLGGNKYSRLNLNGSVFSLRLQKITDGMRTTLPSGVHNQDVKGNEYVIIPASMTFVRTINDKLSWGVGVYVPNSSDVSFTNSLSSVEDFSRFSKTVDYQQGFNIEKVASDYELGFGMGWQALPWLRVGGAVFGIYDKYKYNRSQFENIDAADGSGTITTYYVDNYNVMVSSIGVRATGGIQAELGKGFLLGLMLYSPTIQITSWGEIITSFGAAGYNNLNELVAFASRTSTNIKELDGHMIEPFRAELAFGYKRPKFWLGITGDIYTQLKTPDLLIDKAICWNVAVGGKVFLNPKIAIGGGFFTDNSDAKDPQKFAESKVNYYGLTVGGDFRTPIARENHPDALPIIFGTTLALRYAVGLGEVGGEVFDPTTSFDIREAIIQPVDVTFHELSLYLGTSLFF